MDVDGCGLAWLEEDERWERGSEGRSGASSSTVE